MIRSNGHINDFWISGPRQQQSEHGSDPRSFQLHLQQRDRRLRLHRRRRPEEAQRRRPARLPGIPRHRQRQPSLFEVDLNRNLDRKRPRQTFYNP